MKYNVLILLLLTAWMQPVKADETAATSDSISLNLQEIVVSKSIRENAFLSELPVSFTALSGKKLKAMNALNLRSAATSIPNLYVPDYGSKLTSAIYIRGIGTRMSTSAVGFYVDDVPYLDKSFFDFEWQDLQRVEVLRGPQGTLYGRNAMGGVIHIHTLSPFDQQGSKIRLSYGSYNDLNLQVSHARNLRPNLALSIAANYNQHDGFFTNTTTGKDCGSELSAGARAKLAARFNNGWNVNLTTGFDYSKQDGYAYASYSTGVISYNDPSSYERKMLTAGLSIEKETEALAFHSVTGYQLLDDALALDQDFSSSSVFTLRQNQKNHALTQEFVLKSNRDQAWEWVVGAFGSYSLMDTEAPVQFKQDGIKTLMEDNINGNIPSTMNMSVDITDDVLDIPSDFTEKKQSAALYHQSTWNLPFVKGLSLTGGLRLDYERINLDWNSSSTMNYNYTISYSGMTISDALTANALLEGSDHKDYWQLTPKVSIQYELSKRNRVYASVTRGYQSGGYNVQLFSDLIETELEALMSQQMKTSIASKLQAYVAMGMPQASVDAIVARIPESESVQDVPSVISYDPEYSWNYELGFHAEPVADRLQVDGAVFYIDCFNRQITQFSPNGIGRMMKNASGSFSRGLEISVLAKVSKSLNVNASYGFTEAKFTDYKDSVKVDGTYQEVDYSGNYVPMIPKHTLALGVDYTFHLRKKCLDRINLAAQYNAVGSLYWTEDNDTKQAFYGVTNAQLAFAKGAYQLQFWVKNAFNETYNTFYFESLGNSFAQQGKPRQLGVTVECTF